MTSAAVTATGKPRHPGRLGNTLFGGSAWTFGILVLILLAAVMVALVLGAAPAFKQFGISYIWTEAWSPGRDVYGALAPLYGTLITAFIAMIIGVPFSLGIAMFLTELCPNYLKRPISTAVELLAAVPSIIYGMWGLFVLVPFMQNGLDFSVFGLFDVHIGGIEPLIIGTIGNIPGIG